jgi:CspA family cold shock protein
MSEGTVKWFSEEKGYGFITPDEGDKDVFVHRTGVAAETGGTLSDGARVSFETQDGEKGPKAVDVKPL